MCWASRSWSTRSSRPGRNTPSNKKAGPAGPRLHGVLCPQALTLPSSGNGRITHGGISAPQDAASEKRHCYVQDASSTTGTTPKLSQLEAVSGPGRPAPGPVSLEAAVARGVKLDGWDEYFDYATWHGRLLQPAAWTRTFYTDPGLSARTKLLPWDTIDVGVSKDIPGSGSGNSAYAGRGSRRTAAHGCAGCGAK